MVDTARQLQSNQNGFRAKYQKAEGRLSVCTKYSKEGHSDQTILLIIHTCTQMSEINAWG